MLTKPFATLTFFVACACSSAQESTPRFSIETPARTHPGCTLLALEDGALAIDDAGARVKLPAFLEIRQEGRKLTPLLTRNFVSLTNGDRLPLDPVAAPTLEQNRLRVKPAASFGAGKPFDLFLPNAVLLFWSLPDGVDDAERFFSQLQEAPRKRDVVFLTNGDRIEGAVTSITVKTGCALTVGTRKVQMPLGKIAGIAFDTDRQARLKTKKTYVRVVLEGGARVNLLDLRYEAKSRRFVGKTQFGLALEVPEAALLALDVRQGQAVDLSELAPARYEHRPYLGASWALARDAAATGQPLRLAGSTYEKGLGMHAASQAAYKLDGQYQRFDAIVGIDEASRRGRARVAVDLDGKRIDLNDGKEITGETAPLVIRLDVKGVRTMTLIVETGSFGDVQADVNWAKARFIKSAK